MENVSVKKQYIMDGHGSVTALAESRVSEDGAVVSGITDTYVYDAFSCGLLIKDIHSNMLIEDYIPNAKNADQIALIKLTKEAVASGGLTEHIKDILFEWAKEYDSFEDIWNLIFNL